MSSDAPAPPGLEGLQKIMADAGGRVAILGAQKPQAAATPNKRTCATCYFNPAGKGCQRFPLKMIAVAPGQVQVMAAPAPDGFACGEHRYDHDMVNWRWDDPPRSTDAPSSPIG